jgi:hypothetical protein
MYKIVTNSSRLAQTRRPMSTTSNATVRKGGLSKLTLGALFVAAAGMAYYNNRSDTKTEKSKFTTKKFPYTFALITKKNF